MAGTAKPTGRAGRVRGALLTALTFGLAGPAVGTLIYAAWGMLESVTRTAVGVSVLAGVWLLPFGYVIGLLPAAVTGLAVGILGRGLPAALFVALSAATGAAVMGLVGVFDGSAPEVTEGVFNLAIMGGLAGALTGALSRALASRKREGS